LPSNSPEASAGSSLVRCMAQHSYARAELHMARRWFGKVEFSGGYAVLSKAKAR